MPSNVVEYINQFPENIRELLSDIRSIIQEEAPEAVECISYKIPAYKLNGILVYFAGYEKHLGFYPTGSGVEAFKEQLEGFKYSKGAIQFRLNEPLPEELIRQIVRFRVKENSLKQ